MEDDTFVLCIFSLGEGPKAFEDDGDKLLVPWYKVWYLERMAK